MSPEDQSNIDLMDRQVEVNQWTYNDKMEMLFISQMVFMGLLVAGIFVILSKYGFFDMKFVYFIMIIIAIVIFLFWFFKESYTKNVRDKKSWSKRQFTGDSNTPPAVPPGDVAAAAKTLSDLCNATQQGATGGSSNCVTSN